MGAKREISWKRIDREGERLQIFARMERGSWTFYQRRRRFENWEENPSPPLEDWLELLDGVRRRVPRRLLSPEVENRLLLDIRKCFPDSDVD